MTPTQFIGYARKFCIALVTALGILAIAIENGVTTAEWIQITIAFAGALGVYAAPNVPLAKRSN